MQDNYKSIHKLLHHYNASIVSDSRRCYQYKDYVFFSDPKDANIVQDSRTRSYYSEQLTFRPDYEKLYVIELPESALNHMAHLHERIYNRDIHSDEYAKMVIEKEWAEHSIRSRSPAVQAAWEQYSLMLHLASNGKDLP